ncbi:MULTISPECIES: tetratricopeptide repeat protein [unclassified Pseudoalteromonas]|jgi:signal transduction histidine kinase/CheY-like chemotaxis protein|uniref:tetratricopeptide repeat-containing hybrid sensor histidine kinase/response regulator n=1 Tax=unclassified Pseudoalteromonas TaxID=194690 RepID=UPI0023591113|nr:MULTISPECIES: tetratricopeptide repeat protein [unclassified Pseudoalteromonas]MDC9503667.1 ATP-binding protein [Pseudoalteromonas sp. Angola-18]MDC9531568.1 ATP-binding protein [Pseudoalteromonas sp. Angola-7]
MQGKLKCLLFVLCCVFILPSFAQNSVSLFDEFKKEQQWDVKLTLGNALLEAKNITESQKVSVYSELADLAFSSDDFENALLYFKKLEQHTSLNYLPDMHFRAIKMQGVVFYFQGYFQQAIVEYSRAMVIVEKNNKQVELANLLSNIGLAYFEMNNMELTLEYYLKAKEIYEKKGSAQDQADILLNIAGVYIRLSRYESAILFYKEVLKVYQKLADTSGIAQVNNNLGVAYYESSQFDLALHYYQMALRYYISTNDYNKLSTQYTNLANINLILNNVDVAYEQAKLGVQNALKIANHSLELNALHALAKIQFVRGELADSQKSLDKATDLATQYNSVRIKRDAFGTRSLLEASKGNYAEALTLHEKFVAEQRGINSETITSALAVLQNQFKATQLNQEIQKLKQERKVQKLKMSQRSQLTVFIFVLLFLVIVTGTALYRRGAEKRAKQLLKEQVAQRTAELQAIAQELREANDVKSQFLANISHEIRTPLTAILGQTDDLINGLYEPENLQDELKIIQRHSDHLKSLINDVLDLSKIEANRLELNISCFDIVQLVSDVHAMFITQAKAKHLQIRFDNHVGNAFYTKLDLMRVKQILINLCANAVKFTQAGQVVVSLNKTEQGLVFIVKDTGIGMNSSQLKQIFECFSQADNSISRRFGGTGLGLSLSQQLASMMGGYISVQSEFKRGSQFSLFLPCVEVEKELDEYEHVSAAEQVKQLTGRVVLAEDHPDNRRLISRYLRSMGLEVIAVENGEQAVEKCLQIYPDLVLLDIQMPIMDGRAAFSLLQQCGFQAPIFALTANAMSHEVDDYLALGFTGYLGKPLDKNAFYNTLSQHLGEAKQEAAYTAKIDMSDLVTSFKQSFTFESETISQHHNSNDLEALQKDSHRILGAAQMFALDDIAKAAKNLDMALLNKQSQSKEHIQKLVDELQRVLKKYNES